MTESIGHRIRFPGSGHIAVAWGRESFQGGDWSHNSEISAKEWKFTCWQKYMQNWETYVIHCNSTILKPQEWRVGQWKLRISKSDPAADPRIEPVWMLELCVVDWFLRGFKNHAYNLYVDTLGTVDQIIKSIY